jgi:CBS domain containing-hemolysin-like protein
MDPFTHVWVILLCLVLSAFFSGSETALLRLRSFDIEDEVAAANGPAFFAVRDLLRSTSRLLVTILLGNNVVNILGASIAAAFAVGLLGERLGILVSTVTMTALVLVFAEIFPKAVAARYPRRVSRSVALPLYLFHQSMRPMHLFFDRIIEPVVRRISGGADTEAPTSSEEVLRLARLSREFPSGGAALSIMGAAAEAGEMTVSEILVPRTEIVAFPSDTPATDLLEQVIAERYTRVPVYEGSIDRILGIVHLKDLIKHVREGEQNLQSILKPVLRVPGRKQILRLLQDMQRAFCHMAVVKDEFGVTQGIVTQEDILEEIVGEIRDEFDREELLTIRRLQDDAYEALGRVKVIDFNRETHWEVEAERGDTLSGLVFHTLGRASRKGDQGRVAGYEISVLDVSGSRLTRVHVRRLPEPESISAAEDQQGGSSVG